ncbi:MAG: PqqD family protein [Magnetococcales bacterium]|nr:PqqD family protein [Magnetococcales bacterium]
MADSGLSPSRKSLDPGRLEHLAVSRTGLVFDPVSGLSFTVNTTGLTILELLQSGVSTEEVAHRLTEIYAVTLESATAAVAGFSQQLAQSIP